MDKYETNVIEEFFNHKLGVAVTTREEYNSLFDLLRRLKPDITWRDGSSLCDYDGFVGNGENTYIACDGCHGVTYGNIRYADIKRTINYDLFKFFANGQGRRSLTFEEILFGTEDEK